MVKKSVTKSAATTAKRTAQSGSRRSGLRYGWTPDLPDQRDFEYSAPLRRLGPLPSKVDLRKECPPVYQQGSIQSCTANAIAAAIEFSLLKNRMKVFTPSRLFIYFNERSIQGNLRTDTGAALRDGIKSVHHQGVCPEAMWPYDPVKPEVATNVWAPRAKPAVKPSPECYREALKHQLVSYERLRRSLPQFKGCLASGFPFVFGFTMYDAFEGGAVAKSGVLHMPDLENEAYVGGHAVLAVGYDDHTSSFIVRNSFGSRWGKGGYFTMPYRYLLEENLSDDFWTIRLVEPGS
ncbi:MAG: peptidase [Actinobacteria bacterium]|uniref:Unannotated protein n=1 Tax=freshwater metagenome TaxID=449393 RepID=A0A6J7LAZ4_9ZZZZ|nr:peptidase [Actinomycetota bacterium]